MKPANPRALTPVQIKVLRFASAGLTHAEIGRRTRLAGSTIGHHVRRLELAGLLTPLGA